MPKRELPDNEWIEWWAAQSRFQIDRKGRAPYLPSPAEITIRSKQVRWLEQLGFRRSFIVNIMEFDHPDFERVRMMVQRYGPEETFRRCKEFLLPTEYG